MAAAMAVTAGRADAQALAHRGFVEARGIWYPQEVVARAGGTGLDLLVRYEPTLEAVPWLRVYGGADVRADTRHQVDRAWRLDWGDRTLARPALAIRRLYASARRGRFTLDVGKQLIRWGKADILNPTDRLAPRDFLEIIDSEVLAVTAARLVFERGGTTVDAAIARPSPSRMPLAESRWTVACPELCRGVPPAETPFDVRDAGASFEGGAARGARVARIAEGYDFSVSFYDGPNHLPLVDVEVAPFAREIRLTRIYPGVRMAGGDLAVSFRWFTVKGEAGYIVSRRARADDYLLYVIQLERQLGEWSLAGGYAGQAVTHDRPMKEFAPDRGLSGTVLGRAALTIDARRSVALEAAVRSNLDGVYAKGEYSQAVGQHWRATAGGAIILGNAGDFLGQFRRNSHVRLAVRYSF